MITQLPELTDEQIEEMFAPKKESLDISDTKYSEEPTFSERAFRPPHIKQGLKTSEWHARKKKRKTAKKSKQKNRRKVCIV